MSFADNKKFWREFLHLFKEQRPIWDVKNKDYNNKLVKKECYHVLVKKAQEINSSADEHYVRAKIESLRASFRRELKRVAASKKAGNKYHEPNLWYFNLLLFTADYKLLRKYSIDAEDMEEQIEEHYIGPTEAELNLKREASESPVAFDQLSVASTSNSLPPSTNQTLRKKRKPNISNALDKKNVSILDVTTKLSNEETKSTIFGCNVALQLEDLDYRQRIIAEKLISDVIFHAKLKNLTEHSTISIPPNPSQYSLSSNNFEPSDCKPSQSYLNTANSSCISSNDCFEINYPAQETNCVKKQSNDYSDENSVSDTSSITEKLSSTITTTLRNSTKTTGLD